MESARPRIVVGEAEHDGVLPADWHEPSPGLVRGVRAFLPTIFAKEGLRETDLESVNTPVGLTPVPVAYANDQRHELVIENTAAAGGATVWLSKRPNVQSGQGLALAPGQSVTYRHYKGDVYAVSNVAGPTAVSSQEE